jgi:hypothetical protein
MQTEMEGEMEMKRRWWDRITAGVQPLPGLARSAASMLGAKLDLSADGTLPYLAHFSSSNPAHSMSLVMFWVGMVGLKRE